MEAKRSEERTESMAARGVGSPTEVDAIIPKKERRGAPKIMRCEGMSTGNVSLGCSYLSTLRGMNCRDTVKAIKVTKTEKTSITISIIAFIDKRELTVQHHRFSAGG